MRKRTKENVLCVTAIICLLVCIITARAVSSFHAGNGFIFSKCRIFGGIYWSK